MSSVHFCVRGYNHLAGMDGRVHVIKSFDGGVEGHALRDRGEERQARASALMETSCSLNYGPRAAFLGAAILSTSRYQARPVESISPRLLTLPPATARNSGCRHGYVSAAEFFWRFECLKRH